MTYPKRRQYKYAKKPYRVRNWLEYEAGLRRRGDLTIWFSEDAIKRWTAPASGRPGGQRVYARIAIETALTIRMVFHLALRQTEGFLRSLAEQLDLSIRIPDHTTISRRAKKLGKLPLHEAAAARPIHLLIDSTGLKVHVGRLRRPPKNRAWRKLHVGADAKTGDVVAVDLGSHRARDASRVPALLRQVDRPVSSASADGAYDTEGVYAAIQADNGGRRVRVLIPPPRDARLSPKPSAATKERNRNIRAIRRLGRREWHKHSGYSGRSMVENTIYRYKAILGRAMRARSLAGQRAEASIGCRILNLMAHLGMPDSCRLR
jgi:hypothetical protein